MKIDEIDARLQKILGKKLMNQKIIVKYLVGILQPNEQIEAFATGMFENKTMSLLTTNKRVIIFHKGLIGSTQIEIPIEKINSIGQKKGFLVGELHIWDGSSKIVITKVPVGQISKYVSATNDIINNYKTIKIEMNQTVEKDITDKIEKLAELHKEGILNDYEFATKKMELLEKIQK